MAFDALSEFMRLGGVFCIVIGDPASTGDERFHHLLASHFVILSEYGGGVRVEVDRWAPQDMGLVYAGADCIAAFMRR